VKGRKERRDEETDVEMVAGRMRRHTGRELTQRGASMGKDNEQ